MSILVSGILKSPTGAVIAGAEITLTALTTSPDLLAGVSASAVTSDTGYYGLNMLPGAYSLTVAVNGKSQVYGSFRLDGTETTVTLNMVLRRNLVEVSIPDALLVDFRQIQNNVADDLEAMRQLEFSVSGSADNAARAAADAKVSAEAAARSEANAADSEKSAEQFVQNLQDAVKAADQSSASAALSATEAGKEAAAAKNSALEAANHETAAKEAAINAATEAAEKAAPAAAEQVRAKVAEYADSASNSALNASDAKDAAEKAASNAALSATTAGKHEASAFSNANAALKSGNAANYAATVATAAKDAAVAQVTGFDAHVSQQKAVITQAVASATAKANADIAAATDINRNNAILAINQKQAEATGSIQASVDAVALHEQAGATHETNAGQSAADAALSATKAADSALNAGKSATEAASHATDAQTQAGNAATSAGEARQAALDAQQAATKAATDAVAGAVPAAVEQVKAEIAGNVTRAETAAASAEVSNTGAQKALEEAKLIAKTPGAPGKSAFELWKEEAPPKEDGTEYTMEDFWDAMEGDSGDDGPGAYQTWQAHQPDDADKSLDAFLDSMKGHDGKSAYEIWKENQPAGADTSMTAYLAIYADVKNLRSTNIGGKSVPFILVKQIKQITDLPTGTFVEVQSTTGLLPLIDTAYLSVIANNFGSNKNVFVLYGNGSGRVWTGYRDGAAVSWKELGGSGDGASLADIKPGEVGSIILGLRNNNGVVLAGQDIDGQSVQNPCLRWEGEYGQELKLIATPREGYVGTWTALQNTGASGIGLFVRKR